MEWFTAAGFTDVKITRIGPKWCVQIVVAAEIAATGAAAVQHTNLT